MTMWLSLAALALAISSLVTALVTTRWRHAGFLDRAEERDALAAKYERRAWPFKPRVEKDLT